MSHSSQNPTASHLRVDDANVEQLCRLLTESITSLASDARELRILSTIASDAAISCATDDENDDTTATRLRQIDQSLATVEERVQVLADIVHEEKRALQQVETQHEAALRFHTHLTNMLQQTKLPQQKRHDDSLKHQQQQHTGEDPKTPTLHHLRQQWSTTPSSLPSNVERIEEGEKLDHHTSQQRKLLLQNTTTRRDSFDPRGAFKTTNRIKLDLVTRDELEAIPRTCRGRIALSVLNDALRDIAALCLSKQECNTGSGSREKPPFVLNTAGSKENSSHENSWCVVGEQELRQSCSFFRTGESTARSILLILRTLGRLKQVPAKTGDVTYVVGR